MVMEYEEKDSAGLALVPVLDLSNMGGTIPKEYYQDVKFTKINAFISKTIESQNNNILLALNFKHKKYDVKLKSEKIGELEVYTTDYFINEELKNIVINNVIQAIVLYLVLNLAIFLLLIVKKKGGF